MRSLPLKLDPGSDLRKTIELVGQNENSSGFVLGVVGNLARAAFQCPGKSEPTVLEGNLEIITLNGMFTPNGVHLHLSLSDSDCQVWGGHLEEGTLVLKGADILVGLLNRDETHPLIPAKSSNSENQRLEIAVLPNCPWSARALRMLRSSDIPYFAKTVDNDDIYQSFVKRSQSSTFPQVFIDGNFVGGYEDLVRLFSSGEIRKV